MEAATELRRHQPNPLIVVEQVNLDSLDTRTDPALLHREECWDFILHDAEPWHREHLTKLARLWDHWNREFFDGSFKARPHILLASTCHPDAYGDYARTGGWGGKAQIRIRKSLLRGTHPHVRAGDEFAKGRFLFVADVLLHECIHQYQHEILGIERSNSYIAHGPTFRDMANGIGQKLGLPPVRASRNRGKDAGLPSCSYWPHCVRPDGYYQGAYVHGGNSSRAKAAASLEQELRRLLKKWTKEEILDALQDLRRARS